LFCMKVSPRSFMYLVEICINNDDVLKSKILNKGFFYSE
jgi:hypothetical protein